MDSNLSFPKEVELLCRCSREINKRRFALPGAIVDAHDDLPAIGRIDHFEPAL